MEEDITVDLCVLQSHLDGMLSRVQQNSLTLKRLQAFEMRLLGLTSLTEMIEFILGETKDLFNLDVVSLCLFDPKDEITALLADDHYEYQARSGLLIVENEHLFKHHFDYSDRPLLGLFQAERYAPFFDSDAKRPASVILAPLMRRGRYLGSLNFGSDNSDRFIRNMATDFIEHLASVLSVCLENTLNFEMMRRTSLIDPLTGVNNRRFLEQRIEEEFDRSMRSRRPLSCLFLDIDFFKSINDNFGHQTGDYVLSQVACSIKKQLRSNDVLSRYGGEEFVALLSETDEIIGGEIAERIRSNIAELPIHYNGQSVPVTISVGAATFDPNRTGQSRGVRKTEYLIQVADSALYEAKHAGRNQVKNSGVVF
ncbi:GGDEF domain-containing protein [Methylomonas sp. MgM2]